MKSDIIDLGIVGIEQIFEINSDFCFYDFGKIYKVLLDNNYGELDESVPITSTLKIELNCSMKENDFRVEVVFGGIKDLRFPKTFEFAEFSIKDLRKDQLEGIHYEVVDYGDSDFHCYCRKIEINIIT